MKKIKLISRFAVLFVLASILVTSGGCNKDDNPVTPMMNCGSFRVMRHMQAAIRLSVQVKRGAGTAPATLSPPCFR